jgi:hypothetical protein
MQHVRMRVLYLAFVGVILTFFGCSQEQYRNGLFGNAIISAYNRPYEDQDIYVPHDIFMNSDFLDVDLSLTRHGDSLIIENELNTGFSGHHVKILLTSDLQIHSVDFGEFFDVVDGSSTEAIVEKIILKLDKNPFLDTLVTGHYILQIRNEYSPGELLSSEGVPDTVYYSTFSGKFKNYSKEEIEKGRDWVVEQNEFRMGIKDSVGVYHRVDQFAKYVAGDESLKKLLGSFSVPRSQTNVENKGFVILFMTVNENGTVDTESLRIFDDMKSDELLMKLKGRTELLTGWQPAIYKGKPVKSQVNLTIRIAD